MNMVILRVASATLCENGFDLHLTTPRYGIAIQTNSVGHQKHTQKGSVNHIDFICHEYVEHGLAPHWTTPSSAVFEPKIQVWDHHTNRLDRLLE